MKITLKTLKPRNPLVQPARFRRAGNHANALLVPRQQSRRALQRELEHLARSP